VQRTSSTAWIASDSLALALLASMALVLFEKATAPASEELSRADFHPASQLEVMAPVGFL
jgi:hypothetical protein